MAPSIMKSFKVLAFLTLAATLSCGFPTNVTQAQATDGSTDSFINIMKRNMLAKDLLVQSYLDPIVIAARSASHNNNAEFTKNFVGGMWNANHDFNYVVCRTDAIVSFGGAEGVDWGKGSVLGFSNTKYDLAIGKFGKFTRTGKGGYVNWAWKGSVQKGQNLHSNVIVFVKPGGMDSDIGSGGD